MFQSLCKHTMTGTSSIQTCVNIKHNIELCELNHVTRNQIYTYVSQINRDCTVISYVASLSCTYVQFITYLRQKYRRSVFFLNKMRRLATIYEHRHHRRTSTVDFALFLSTSPTRSQPWVSDDGRHLMFLKYLILLTYRFFF